MQEKKVFLFPSCASNLLDKKDCHSMLTKIKSILKKLNYQVILLNLPNECCGLMYHSLGFPNIAEKKLNHFLESVKKVTENKKHPILIENSSCFLEILSSSNKKKETLNINDVIIFIYNELKDYPLKKQDKTIMLHVNCSITRLKKNDEIISLAQRCAQNTIIPFDILCCGFAGSKGFSNPELNKNALKTLKEQIPSDCKEGYTCLETCALGFTKHSGIPYYSIFHLIDDCMS